MVFNGLSCGWDGGWCGRVVMQVPGSVEWRGEGGIVVVGFGNGVEEGGGRCNARVHDE